MAGTDVAGLDPSAGVVAAAAMAPSPVLASTGPGLQEEHRMSGHLHVATLCLLMALSYYPEPESVLAVKVATLGEHGFAGAPRQGSVISVKRQRQLKNQN